MSKMVIVTLVWSAVAILGPDWLSMPSLMKAAPVNVPQWVSDADRLIKDLSIVANKVSATGSSTNFDDRAAIQKEVDRLLFGLWLTTGSPPLVEDQGRLSRKLLELNISAYTRYVADHSNLTCEELHRQGLTNAIDAIGSPLWYMTLKYLTMRASVMSNWHIEIHSTPERLLIIQPLSKKAYKGLSIAFSEWLDANRERMVWNVNRNGFRPQSGGYVGTDRLRWTIVLESSTPEEAAYLRSRAKEVPKWKIE